MDNFTVLFETFADAVAERLNNKSSKSESAEEKFFTVNEICTKYRISQATFYRHRDAGFIKPSMYVGRKPLFSQKAIDEYISFFNN